MPERLWQPVFLIIQQRQGKQVQHSVFSFKECRVMISPSTGTISVT